MTSRRMRHSPRDQRKVPMLRSTYYSPLTPSSLDGDVLTWLNSSRQHFFCRYYVENTVKLSSLHCEVTTPEGTAGSTVSFAIYSTTRYAADHAPTGPIEPGMPHSLMHNLGSVAADTLGTKTINLSPHIVVRPGHFWLCMTTDNGNTSMSMRSMFTESRNMEDSNSDGFSVQYWYSGQETAGTFPEYFDGLSRPTDAQLADSALRAPVWWGVAA